MIIMRSLHYGQKITFWRHRSQVAVAVAIAVVVIIVAIAVVAVIIHVLLHLLRRLTYFPKIGSSNKSKNNSNSNN